MIVYCFNFLFFFFVGKILSSNFSVMGIFYYMVGRIDERCRVKSYGCYGLGMFRMIVRWGWRSVGFGVVVLLLLGFEEEDVVFEGSELLVEMMFVGVDNVWLWVGGCVMMRWL